jgi:hypothetical protein
MFGVRVVAGGVAAAWLVNAIALGAPKPVKGVVPPTLLNNKTLGGVVGSVKFVAWSVMVIVWAVEPVFVIDSEDDKTSLTAAVCVSEADTFVSVKSLRVCAVPGV